MNSLKKKNILHAVYWQLPIEVNCVSLLLYTLLHLYMIFTLFYINDSAARVTHFSSALIFSIDKLTSYFFTSFYLMMTLQNNLLVPTRECFAQSTPGM